METRERRRRYEDRTPDPLLEEGGFEDQAVSDRPNRMFHLLNRRSVVRGTSLVCFAIVSLIFGGLLALNYYTMEMYTYWNMTLVWYFFLCLSLGCYFSNELLDATLIFFLPVAMCSPLVVSVTIILILKRNGFLMTQWTIYGMGDHTIGDIHAGDYAIHPLPLLVVLYALLLGVSREASSSIKRYYYHSIGNSGRIRYAIYWYLSPLVPLGVYSIFKNPFTHYPTDVPAWAWFAVVILMVLLHQSVSLMGFLSKSVKHTEPGGYRLSSDERYNRHFSHHGSSKQQTRTLEEGFRSNGTQPRRGLLLSEDGHNN